MLKKNELIKDFYLNKAYSSALAASGCMNECECSESPPGELSLFGGEGKLGVAVGGVACLRPQPRLVGLATALCKRHQQEKSQQDEKLSPVSVDGIHS
jgi:hypothetical protein